MIRHIAGIAEIVEDIDAAVAFYRDILGLAVEYDGSGAYADIKVPGVLHFGIWSRHAAAEAMYGDVAVARRIPLGFTVGFEVDSVESSTSATASAGVPFQQRPKTEPWGQVTSRFFSPGGALCEFSETPWARRIAQPMQTGGEED